MALMAVLALAASPVQADEVDDYLAAQMKWLHLTGVSLAVVRDGKLVKAAGYGWANLETKTPASPESVYKLGSLSKQFIAAAVLLLVQDGRLGLDDPVNRILAESPETWSGITIRHLLTHTSGLVREVPDFDPFKVQSDADVLRSVAALPLRFPPGDHWEYSNVGYYALAEVIRTVTHRPWSEFVAERVFAPAGMNATRTTTAEIVPGRAAGYAGRGGALVNAADWVVVRPSGAFLSTVLDLAKWDVAMSDDRVLPASARTAMWTPVTLNDGSRHPYGFGWFVDANNGHRRIHHDGGVPGFSSDFERFPDDGLTVILLANREGRDLRDLAIQVAGSYVPALRPPVEPPIAGTDPETRSRIRRIVEDMAAGTLDPGQFAGDLGRILVAEMNAGFGATLRSLGRIETFELIEQKDEADGRFYRFRAGFPHVPLFVRCTINGEGRIAKFSISD